MAKIFPFKGILYNRERIKDLSLVTAPPYDVISKEEQEKYYMADEYNIVRLILGKEYLGDNEHNNKYVRATRFLKTWIEQKVLIQDSESCIYLYSQEYTTENEKRTQKGFICALLLEEFAKEGAVLPHEKTMEKPKEDRFRVIEACQANLSPIFGLYSDPGFRITEILGQHMSVQPFASARDDNGTTHKLWRTSNPETMAKIQQILAPQQLYIADGHHRYETALRYRNQRRMTEKNLTGSEPFNYIMIYLSNMDDENLTILPAHRVILPTKPQRLNGIEEKLKQFFLVKTCSNYEELSLLMKKGHGRENAFGLYDGEKLLFLKLNDIDKYVNSVATELPQVYKTLDVVVAHQLVIDHIINEGEKMPEDRVDYIKDTRRALQLVDEKKFSFALLLNPTRIEQVKAIASLGMKMPGKATYFYPKPLSGLVIHKF